MDLNDSHFELALASSDAEIREAQRLRYAVFIEELGGDGTLVDHHAPDRGRPVRSPFRPSASARPPSRAGRGRGGRLPADARRSGRGGRPVLFRRTNTISAPARLGSPSAGTGAVLPAPRLSGRPPAMLHMWNGLADYIAAHGIEVMFGVASFHGTDPDRIRGPLSLLHPPASGAVRHPSRGARDGLPGDGPDRGKPIWTARPRSATQPALIQRPISGLGGVRGAIGAYIDRPFNCIDVCLVMDMARMSERQQGDLHPRLRHRRKPLSVTWNGAPPPAVARSGSARLGPGLSPGGAASLARCSCVFRFC